MYAYWMSNNRKRKHMFSETIVQKNSKKHRAEAAERGIIMINNPNYSSGSSSDEEEIKLEKGILSNFFTLNQVPVNVLDNLKREARAYWLYVERESSKRWQHQAWWRLFKKLQRKSHWKGASIK